MSMDFLDEYDDLVGDDYDAFKALNYKISESTSKVKDTQREMGDKNETCETGWPVVFCSSSFLNDINKSLICCPYLDRKGRA